MWAMPKVAIPARVPFEVVTNAFSGVMPSM